MSSILITNRAEPNTPDSGKTEIYVDSTSKKLSTKDDAGSVTEYGSGGGGGSGDVTGPGSSVDNAIVRFDGATGKIIQSTTNGPLINDLGELISIDGTYGGVTKLGGSHTLSGNNSVAIGVLSKAGLDATGIGYNASATGGASVALGTSANASGGSGFALGGSSVASGAIGSIAIGTQAQSTTSRAIGIGYQASATSSHNICIGASSTTGTQVGSIMIGGVGSCTASRGVCAGYNSDLTGAFSVVYGGESSCSGVESIVLGTYATTTHNDCLVVGHEGNSGQNNSANFGGAGAMYHTFYLGQGFRKGNTNTTDLTIQVSKNSAAGTDINGSDLVMKTGTASGAGEGGSFRIEVADGSGVSGTTENETFNLMYKATSAQENIFTAKDNPTADASLHNGSMSAYLDESGNNLVFKVKYSNGTVKTGTVALV
jgi:hypothetical protein